MAVAPRVGEADSAATAGIGVFGFNQDNQFGGVVRNGVPAPPESSSLYRASGAPVGAIQIAGGDSYFDALYPDGTVLGWGGDAYQAEGVGNHPFGAQPPERVGLTGITAIAASNSHTLFLGGSGVVYASGDNVDGDVGDTGSCCGYFPSPAQVSNLSGATAVAASGNASFALLSDGTVDVWGQAPCAQGTYDAATAIPGLSGVTAIAGYAGSSGAGRIIALKSDGTLWLAGQPVCGAPAQVPGLTGVQSLGVGGDVIKTDGTVWSVTATGATQIAGLANVTSVYTSSQGALSVAVESDGSVWSWGTDNQWGQLGDGTMVAHTTPHRVALMSGGVAIGVANQSAAVEATSVVPLMPTGGPVAAPETFGNANPAEPCLCAATGTGADPVNTGTGDFTETATDLSVPGRGLPLAFARTYNSLIGSAGGLLGYGWSFSYGMSVAVDGSTGNATVTQENGSQVVFTSSAGGFTAPPRVQATLVQNADGSWVFTRRARTRFAFDSSGRLTGETDLNGYTTTVSYPDGGTIVITDPAGRTFTCQLSGGHITSVTDTASPARTVAFAYDDAGNLTSVTDVRGGVTTYSYDPSHLLLTVRSPRFADDTTTTPSPVVTNEYDGQGRVVSQTNQLGATTTFDYGSVPGSTIITDPNGNETLDTYQNGLRTDSIQGYGSSTPADSAFYYDPDTLGLAGSCNANGACTTATYDAAGDPLTQTDALGRTTTYTYDALNDVTSVTDPTSVKTTMTYDSAGNPLTRSRPLLSSTGSVLATQTTAYGYGATTPNRPGDVTSVTDPNGQTTQLRYDAYGDLVSTTSPSTPEDSSGNTTTYGYDTGTGLLTSVTSAKGNVAGANAAAYTTTYAYDAAGHLLSVHDPLWSLAQPTQHQQSFQYDADGNLTQTTDGDDNTTKYDYDPAGELTQTTRADGTTLKQDYWPNGALHDTYDATGAATGYAYDAAGRLATITDPLNRVTTYQSDAAGNPVTICTSLCTSYAFDADNEITGIAYNDGKTPAVTSITYNADGRRTAMTDGTGTTSYSYDSLGRLTSTTNGANQTVGYTYDLDNNATSITYPNGKTVTRGFDNTDRLASVTDWNGNKTTFGYDPDSNLHTTTFPAATSNVDTNAYNAADQLTSIAMTQGSTSLANVAYTRDGAGQLASTTPTGLGQSNESYTYTPLNQLASVNTGTYSYDQADNLTALPGGQTQAYDAANEITSVTAGGQTTPYSYDTPGDRTQGAVPPTTATYAYNAAQELVSTPAISGPTLAGGDADSLAVTSSGQVDAWGANASGQLGNNTTTNASSPVSVSGLTAVASVASGSAHSLALKNDGTVWAWGLNSSGQLGNNSTTNTTAPVQVSHLTGIAAIAAAPGGAHSLALKSNGSVWAWGLNASGQVGNNSTTNATTPVQVLSLGVAIAAGASHSLAIRNDGTVWAWGLNSSGQLGNNSTTTAKSPVQVRNLTSATAVAGGASHSLALKSDGTVWAWGLNSSGQLGNGTTTTSKTPVQVKNLTNIIAIAAGANDSLALKSDGTVWAWGLNSSGQLGNGTTTNATTPVQVKNLTGIATIGSGASHSLYATTVGAASAVGLNSTGQLGNGTTTNASTAVAVTNLHNVASSFPAAYTYNGDALRSAATSQGITQHYAWDTTATNPLLLTDGSTNYIYGPNDLPIEQINSAGSISYYHHDQLGSTRMLTSTTGAVTATYSYSPYGQLTSQTGSADTPLRWAGQYQDPATGLYYLRARYYDPATGQFLTRDPLDAQTQQAYSYGDDNPLNNADPSGRCDIDPFGSDSCVADAAEGAGSGLAAAGKFLGNNWRPIASAAGDIGTAGACVFSAGTLCVEAVGVNTAGQSLLAATGPGSTGSKLGRIGVNLLLAGGAAAGAGAGDAIDGLQALNDAYKPAGWVRPFVSGTGAAPYLGYTAGQLASYPWQLC